MSFKFLIRFKIIGISQFTDRADWCACGCWRLAGQGGLGRAGGRADGDRWQLDKADVLRQCLLLLLQITQ